MTNLAKIYNYKIKAEEATAIIKQHKAWNNNIQRLQKFQLFEVFNVCLARLWNILRHDMEIR